MTNHTIHQELGEMPNTVPTVVPAPPGRVPPAAPQMYAGLRDGLLTLIDRFDRSPAGRKDVMGVLPTLMRASLGPLFDPAAATRIGAEWTTGMARSFTDAMSLAVGVTPTSVGPTDKRYRDPSWKANPAFFWLREQHEHYQHAVAEMVDAAGLTESEQKKARFLTQAIVDAIAPTNSMFTNPAVIKRAIETGGGSLGRGAQNFLDDLANNNGRPRQVAPGVHEVGRNLAVTPGKVVFANDLMELIQYAPTTVTVHEIPLLLSPPWINKYYIMDLAPGRSLVEWAVNHGHTVFVISYRNPDITMHDVTMDDYLISGPRAALDVVTDITGTSKVNLLGLCLGGTLTMSTLAFLDSAGDDRINSATFLNTLLDFDEPGALGVTTDPDTVSKLEVVMEQTGFLPSENMSNTFDMLRANDLIWNYVVNNWLLGDPPPAFDILSWNSDSTRMPAAMHSFYLRSCYLENRLAKGTMELAGTRLDLSRVKQDMYFLAAEQDHIAPWRSSYAGARLPAGKVRFVLSNSGHIAGIVNPPNPKSQHWVNDDAAAPLPESADDWRTAATLHPVTWWEDWATWIDARAGEQIAPPTMGSDQHPPTLDAPGTYVLNA